MSEFDKEFEQELKRRINVLKDERNAWQGLTSTDYIWILVLMLLGITALFVGWFI